MVFKGASLPDNAASMAPPNFSFGFSDNGWMTAMIFYEYIANVFEPWLTDQNIMRPIIFYLDGHISHLSLDLSKFCSVKQIVLIALLPNATHILQPLDVAFFKPLKVQWHKEYEKFCKNCLTVGIHKYQFAPLLNMTFNSIDVTKILKSGFKKCGLFPFNFNAVDLTRVLKKNKNSSTDIGEFDVPITNESHDNLAAVNCIEKLLSEEQLVSFQANEGPFWNGAEKDCNLYSVWYNLRNSDRTTNVEHSQVIFILYDEYVE